MRLLLIDDDEPALEVLARQLTRHRFAVDMAVDASSAQEYVSLFRYDLLLLDVSLPDLDGIRLCQRLRSQGHTMPILIVTGRDQPMDKVEGLNAGADDYVAKPFNLNELIARIYALLRRQHNLPPVLEWGDLSLNSTTFEVSYGDGELTLTPKEFGILELFLRAPAQVRSPGTIIESLWADEDPPHEDVVRTHIKGLRQKLKRAGAPKDLIETVYGLGYRLNKQWEAHDDDLADASSEDQTDQTQAALVQAWEIYGPMLQQRASHLQALLIAATQGSITDEWQHQARAEAHKLVGSLGSFGLTHGAQIAKQIEHLLNTTPSPTLQHLSTLYNWTQTLQQELDQTTLPTVAPILSPSWMSWLDSLLLLGDDGSDWIQQLIQEAECLGLQVQGVPLPLPEDWLDRVQDHFHIPEQGLRGGVLLSAALMASPDRSGICEHGLQALGDLRDRFPQLGILVVLPVSGLMERLQVVQQGADRVLQDPVLPEQVIQAMAQLVNAKNPQKRVIVVDDDPAFLAALQARLAPWPFQLLTYGTADELWHGLSQHPPDLLVLDIQMPDTSGLELCQVLRSDPLWQALPVIFLTRYGDPDTHRQAYGMGADDLLTKPIEAEELADRILNRLRRVQRPLA